MRNWIEILNNNRFKRTSKEKVNSSLKKIMSMYFLNGSNRPEIFSCEIFFFQFCVYSTLQNMANAYSLPVSSTIFLSDF